MRTILFWLWPWLLAAGAAGDDPSWTRLALLHTGGARARFDQITDDTTYCMAAQLAKKQCMGGFARTMTVVKRVRALEKTVGGPIVLFLYTGGIFTGTVWFNVYNWTISCDVLNTLKPDAVAVSTFEFQLGIEGLVQFSKCLTVPLLAANMDVQKIGQKDLKVNKSVTVVRGNTKIGIIGYVDSVNTGKEMSKYYITDSVRAVQEEAAALEKAGTHIIIVIGRSSIQAALKIAAKIPQVDAVLTSGELLWNGKPPSIEVPYDKYPKMVHQPDGSQVAVGSVRGCTKYLGCLNISVAADGQVKKAVGQPFYMHNGLVQDADIQAVLAKYRPLVEQIEKSVVGQTKVQLEGDGNDCHVRECNLGNLIADAYVAAAVKEQRSSYYWTHAAIGLVHAGAIRASIDVQATKGNITLVELMDAHPYGHQVIMFTCTGETLRVALEASAKQDLSAKHKTGEFLQYSGVQVRYDMNRPAGKRVTQAKVLCAHCDVPTYEDIRGSRTYNVVAPDYLITNMPGYAVLKQNHFGRVVLPHIDVEVLQRYVSEHSPIYTGERDSIVIVHNSKDENAADACQATLLFAVLAVAVFVFIK